MDEILKKGGRLVKPRTISLPLRCEVYDWLVSVAAEKGYPTTFIARSIIEDAYDRREQFFAPKLLQEEVTGNE